MKKYIFYIRQNGEEDGSKVWTSASSKEEAIDNIKREYWGIDEILLIKCE